MRNFPKLVGTSIIILIVTLALVGCSAPFGAGSSASATAARANLGPDDIIVLVGPTANQPRPELPVEAQPVIEAGIEAKAPITVISVDGTPAVSFHAAGYEINTDNPVAEQDDVNKVQSALLAAVRGAKADSNGSNLSAALAIAGDQAKADGAKHAVIIVVDSGLSDAGYPDLTTPGITETDPADVVSFAAKHNEIPSVPADTSVYLTGIGYGSGKQVPLTSSQRKDVTAIWKGMLVKSGAKVFVIPTPRSGAPAKTKYTAGTVQPAALAQFTVEHDGDTLRATVSSDMLFQPDKWDLLPSATAALGQLVTLLKQNSGTVTVEGFTDIGTTSVHGGLVALSQHRADAVKAYLVANGIASSRIKAVGEGTGGATEASPDNRRVSVIVTPAVKP